MTKLFNEARERTGPTRRTYERVRTKRDVNTTRAADKTFYVHACRYIQR